MQYHSLTGLVTEIIISIFGKNGSNSIRGTQEIFRNKFLGKNCFLKKNWKKIMIRNKDDFVNSMNYRDEFELYELHELL